MLRLSAASAANWSLRRCDDNDNDELDEEESATEDEEEEEASRRKSRRQPLRRYGRTSRCGVLSE